MPCRTPSQFRSGGNAIFSFMPAKRAAGLDRRKSLEAIPVVNGGVKATDGPAGLVLKVIVLRGSGFLARFQPAVMERRVELDEIGSFVFRLIDGKRTALDIVGAFVGRYRTNRREAELSCVEFLKSLVRRHVISIAVPGGMT